MVLDSASLSMPATQDSFVQATNNSSIVSKRSVEKLYNGILYPGHPRLPHVRYFEHFVPRFKRRSPAINRGYLLRLLIFKQSLQTLLREAARAPGKVYVVNLGCGFDPTPFEFLDGEYDNNGVFAAGTAGAAQMRALRERLVFVDIDYHDLIDQKARAITASAELARVLGLDDTERHAAARAANPALSKSIYRVVTDKYIAVQCDLNQSGAYLQILRDLKLHSSCSSSSSSLSSDPVTKVFIAEISITYMPPAQSDLIVKHSMACDDAHFLVLEQLVPCADLSNKFVQRMLRHFHNVRSPIQTVEYKYRTLEQQRQRYAGLSSREESGGEAVLQSPGHCNHPAVTVELATVMQYWNHYIDSSLKREIARAEPFDEYEEFNLFCQHYYFGHITNTRVALLARDHTNTRAARQRDAAPLLDCLAVRVGFRVQDTTATPLLQRRFSAGCAFESNKVLVNSGFSSAKLNTSVVLAADAGAPEYEFGALGGAKPAGRLCHAVVRLGADKYMLLGGRSAPDRVLGDCWILERAAAGPPGGDGDGSGGMRYTWRETASMPEPRFRFSAVRVNATTVVVVGGTTNPRAAPFLRFDVVKEQWAALDISCGSAPFAPRLGSAVAAAPAASSSWSSLLYVAGGMLSRETDEIDDSLYEVTLSGVLTGVAVRRVASHSLLGRFGAAMAAVGGKLLLLGGVSGDFLADRDTTLVQIDPAVGAVVKLRVDDQPVWDRFPLLVAGLLVADRLDAATAAGTMHYVGGGAVCYSFGSYWNDILSISVNTALEGQPFPLVRLEKAPPHLAGKKSKNKPGNEPENKQMVAVSAVERTRWSVAVAHAEKPVVVEGLQVPLFSVDALRALVGAETPVAVTELARNARQKDTVRTVLFGTFLSTVLSPSGGEPKAEPVKKYRLSHALAAGAAGLLSPELVGSAGASQKVEIVSSKVAGPLRFDSRGTAHLQLRGEQTVRMYPAIQAEQLGASSIVDVFSRNPKLAHNTNTRLTPWETVVKAGEAVVVPAGWAYALRSSNGVSVSLAVPVN